jgi:hypothetical protein
LILAATVGRKPPKKAKRLVSKLTPVKTVQDC